MTGKGRKCNAPLSQKAKGHLSNFIRDGQKHICDQIVCILADHPDLRFSASQIRARLKDIRVFCNLHGLKKDVKEHIKSLQAINCDDRAKVDGDAACFGSRIVAGLSVICETPEKFGLLLLVVSVYPSLLSIISSSL